MKKKPLIIGIDPGTTTGYALLDFQGELIDINSGKTLGINEIIKRLISKGLSVVMGTDKAKVPDFVDKVAIKLGCRLVFPDHDLTTIEKREMTTGFDFRNAHEMDALASALFAFESFTKLTQKVKHFVQGQKKEHLFEELLVLVVKESIPIKDAIDILERPVVEQEEVKKVIERSPGTKEYVQLYNRFKRIEKELKALRRHYDDMARKNRELSKHVKKQESKRERKNHINSKKIDTLFSFKEKRLSEYSKQLSEARKEINELKKELEHSQNFTAHMGNSYLIKKMKNFNEFDEKRKMLAITQHDLIFVEDPTVFTQAVQNISVRGMLFDKKPSSKLLSEITVSTIYPVDFPLIEYGDFMLAKKSDIDRKLEKKHILNNVIREYKEKRLH